LPARAVEHDVSVIASEAKQSMVLQTKNGLLRRSAPRNDGIRYFREKK
jgi:hypothetical protein